MDRQRFETGGLYELVDKCRYSHDECRIEVDFGGEHPSVIVRPHDAGRLCPPGLVDPRRTIRPSRVREGFPSFFEQNVSPLSSSVQTAAFAQVLRSLSSADSVSSTPSKCVETSTPCHIFVKRRRSHSTGWNRRGYVWKPRGMIDKILPIGSAPMGRGHSPRATSGAHSNLFRHPSILRVHRSPRFPALCPRERFRQFVPSPTFRFTFRLRTRGE